MATGGGDGAMNTERDNWKNVTAEDATDAELRLVHKIHGPKPDWMDADNWRNNMRAIAKDIREHVASVANEKDQV